MPGPVTCFEGIKLPAAGPLPAIELGGRARGRELDEPPTGRSTSPTAATRTPARPRRRWSTSSRRSCSRAVERRLRADVPVVSYLSAAASIRASSWRWRARSAGRPIPTFTIQIDDAEAGRESEAAVDRRRHLGAADPVVVDVGADEVLAHLPAS